MRCPRKKKNGAPLPYARWHSSRADLLLLHIAGAVRRNQTITSRPPCPLTPVAVLKVMYVRAQAALGPSALPTPRTTTAISSSSSRGASGSSRGIIKEPAPPRTGDARLLFPPGDEKLSPPAPGEEKMLTPRGADANFLLLSPVGRPGDEEECDGDEFVVEGGYAGDGDGEDGVDVGDGDVGEGGVGSGPFFSDMLGDAAAIIPSATATATTTATPTTATATVTIGTEAFSGDPPYPTQDLASKYSTSSSYPGDGAAAATAAGAAFRALVRLSQLGLEPGVIEHTAVLYACASPGGGVGERAAIAVAVLRLVFLGCFISLWFWCRWWWWWWRCGVYFRPICPRPSHAPVYTSPFALGARDVYLAGESENPTCSVPAWRGCDHCREARVYGGCA